MKVAPAAVSKVKPPFHFPKPYLNTRRLLNKSTVIALAKPLSHPLSSAMCLNSHIDKVLWSPEDIQQRVAELASQISYDFAADSRPLVVVGIATGAFLFLADLVRKIRLPLSVDLVRAQSYGSGTFSNGAPVISLDLKLDVKGKHVILVEDIVDTGITLCCLIAHMESKGASSVSVCAFLDKPARRTVNFELTGNGKFYRGFECPDLFVVGYGMDYAELYRNLPYVGVLKPQYYM